MSRKPIQSPSRPANRDTSSVAHILVAEDNMTTQRLILLMIEALGHKVTLVKTGSEALAAMRDGAYDLLLMDIQMPELDGLAAARMIRDLPPPACRIPIVAVTGDDSRENLFACREAGIDDFLSKPLTWPELEEMLRRYLSRDGRAPGELTVTT
ncbi:MAG TPA: response regulator [Stellaceae bacterium]|nr:response regulator [Stellaceae bacterium]